MGEGREPGTESGRPTHEDLVERIAAGAAGASREARARAMVEAIAELLDRDAAHTSHLLAELLEDDGAQERLTALLKCPVVELSALLGGTVVALSQDPRSADRRDRVSSALALLLSE